MTDAGDKNKEAPEAGASGQGEDLSKKSLVSAYAHGVDARGINLDSSNMTGAILRRANLGFADLRGASWNESTLWPEGIGALASCTKEAKALSRGAEAVTEAGDNLEIAAGTLHAKEQLDRKLDFIQREGSARCLAGCIILIEDLQGRVAALEEAQELDQEANETNQGGQE